MADQNGTGPWRRQADPPGSPARGWTVGVQGHGDPRPLGEGADDVRDGLLRVIGVPIAAEKKTTIFRMTVVQRRSRKRR